ncbi:aarF domain-containing protein kinase 1-like [Gadus macrocephalus]|uniref:aarF domain-containing protein kinase 1-like n=1 Tax=Gadus macrocephalus TaxID=80720 RepID=UPI0028CB3889|nr:aarF domain-containing protein kinase 1-like [Gadus macrocephalus]XP_059908895.1 aarF domain-containing protein kinase 1-like [Gadus macrocephalus]
MAGRLLKVSSVATALVATSGVYLYTKQLDPNDLSLVRFGRAAAATAVISYDYLTAFRNVEPGTDEYSALKSKVMRGRHACCLSLAPRAPSPWS